MQNVSPQHARGTVVRYTDTPSSLAVTSVALPVLVLLGGIIGAAWASLLSYAAILVAQRRLMRASREIVPGGFAAGIPPKLDPVA